MHSHGKSKPKTGTPRRRLIPRGMEDNFAIVRIGQKKFWFSDLYIRALSMSWGWYIALIAILYFTSNFFFAGVYWLDSTGIENARQGSFLDMYFFSVQTMATIGYGKMAPNDLIVNIVVTVEALWGFTFFAFVTGLAFARFSRPTARVLFSEVAVISDYEGQPHLKIRVANQRSNRVVNVNADLVLLRKGTTKEGYVMRRFFDLPLNRKHSPLLLLSWTLMHPIDENSPLYGATAESLRENEDEIIVSLSGHDETLSQTIHARHSYIDQEIICSAFFEDILAPQDDGSLEVNFNKFHSYLPAEKKSAKK